MAQGIIYKLKNKSKNEIDKIEEATKSSPPVKSTIEKKFGGQTLREKQLEDAKKQLKGRK